MAKIYTDDLIRFIYNETTTEESNDISVAILSNSYLMADYESLSETITQLDSISMIPSPTSIKIIMEEARRQSAEFAH
jgi:hypothetical protein